MEWKYFGKEIPIQKAYVWAYIPNMEKIFLCWITYGYRVSLLHISGHFNSSVFINRTIKLYDTNKAIIWTYLRDEKGNIKYRIFENEKNYIYQEFQKLEDPRIEAFEIAKKEGVYL
jgi:hypothetical protein